MSDTRGFSGERFSYRLIVRKAKPGFVPHLNGANPLVNAGSGRDFSVTIDRLDGFEGEVLVHITNLPPGFVVSSPLVIQAGHNQAEGTLCALAGAAKPTNDAARQSKVTARAWIDGQWITKPMENFGIIQLAERPKAWIALEPSAGSKFEPPPQRSGQVKPIEITIAPGQTIPAWLKVKRNGHDDLMTFTVEGLPHGIIVDNIGLNGVLIPKGESEREIFISAEKWVPETDRFCFAIENQAGRQTSFPVLLKVRKGKEVAAGIAR